MNASLSAGGKGEPVGISVVIPAFNEEKAIHAALENLMTFHKPDEVIVVDGGSMDETVRIASRWAPVIHSPKGRAAQMNAGAAHAKGDILLFLHADTLLPLEGLETIKHRIAQGTQAGRFRMRFDARRWLLRLYESYTRFHCFSYGDQGFFVKRDVFNKLGGFSEDVPFEDVDFYRRLRQYTQPVIIKDPVITSARRFSGVGFLRQKFINIFLVALYYAGFDIFLLKKKLYPEVR
jgi:rSAM/selenodomain-associated transferase 2